MTRYIRKIPCKKVRSVPAENERKAEAVPFHENQNHKTLFLWIPISFALAYGSISFVLLESNIVSWTLSARLYLLIECAWLVCISKFGKKQDYVSWPSHSIGHHFLRLFQLFALLCRPHRVVSYKPLPIHLHAFMAGIFICSFRG